MQIHSPVLLFTRWCSPTRLALPSFPTRRSSDLFGTVFTDHMARATWTAEDGWTGHRVEAYGPLSLDPAAAVLHYAQERSEEHTSELQSRGHLVCRLLLEKKKASKIGPAQLITS